MLGRAARARSTRRSRRSRTATASPTSGRASAATSRSRARASSPDDVVDRRRPRRVRRRRRRSDPAKDVGIRADRADGFVLRNLKVRHADEHDIYVLETDGYLLDRFKTFYARRVRRAHVRRGPRPDAELRGRRQRRLGPLPGRRRRHRPPARHGDLPEFRYSQEIRDCDSHHNTSGYSGTDGNADARRTTTTSTTTRSASRPTSSRRPGTPASRRTRDLIENNNFYSNNFNPYLRGLRRRRRRVPVPVGTGLWIAGGNDNVVRNNHFYDNWRRGAMLFAVPDQRRLRARRDRPDAARRLQPDRGAAVDVVPQPVLRQRDGHRARASARSSRTAPATSRRAARTSGGTSSSATTGNCWHDNTGPDGTAAQRDEHAAAAAAAVQLRRRASAPSGPQQEPELLNCLADIEFDTSTCPWFTTPSQP